MVQMGLESSGSIHYASSPDFVKAAMNNEYGEYSVQCMSDCFDEMLKNFSNFKNKFRGDPQLDVFLNDPVPMYIPKSYSKSRSAYSVLADFQKAQLICAVLKNVLSNKFWKDNATAQKVLRRTLCEKVEYSDIQRDRIISLLNFVDKENCPFLSSRVIAQYAGLL
ncbi:unnamed protein product [Ambrosiozyma monospora]|uniref:Unnamed protein product n=1 Tax=Ambrosiozyma monospora TaxID=43982 RepID=A0A9W6YN18_AMBMO|nr:unnamed protein product [Ambrosiozyma monospora]